jgi:hypothetical protein
VNLGGDSARKPAAGAHGYSNTRLPQYLPWVILLDAEDEYREFRFRVVGTRVAQYFLSDATGKDPSLV